MRTGAEVMAQSSAGYVDAFGIQSVVCIGPDESYDKCSALALLRLEIDEAHAGVHWKPAHAFY